MERRLPEAVKVIRESDEECLKLIALVRGERDGVPWPSEAERLLDNLEARIKEMQREKNVVAHMVEEMRIDREFCQAENAHLRVQLADLGAELVKLTGEIERLHSVCVIKDEEIASLRSELAGARQKIDAMRDERQPAGDCPCGTETCREAWRELRQAKADDAPAAQLFTNPPHTAVRQCTKCGAYVGSADPPHRCEQAKADEKPCGMWCASHNLPLDRHRGEVGCVVIPVEAQRVLEAARAKLVLGASGFRDIIREEVAYATQGLPDILREAVAKETAESSREIAVQLMALGERLSAVELHEAANKPGQASIRLRTVLCEEVAAEVARQLAERDEPLRGCQDGRKDPIGRLTFGKLKSALRPLIDRDLAHNGTGWNQSLGYWMCGLFVDAINGAMGFPAETHVEEAVEEALETRDLVYCPCGTKADHERQEARNEREGFAPKADEPFRHPYLEAEVNVP